MERVEHQQAAGAFLSRILFLIVKNDKRLSASRSGRSDVEAGLGLFSLVLKAECCVKKILSKNQEVFKILRLK